MNFRVKAIRSQGVQLRVAFVDESPTIDTALEVARTVSFYICWAKALGNCASAFHKRTRNVQLKFREILHLSMH